MWGLSTAQKEKGRETGARGAEERRESQPCHAEEIRETHSPQAPRRLHLEARGRGWVGRAASSRTGPEVFGASEAAPGLHQGGGGSFFPGEQTFY